MRRLNALIAVYLAAICAANLLVTWLGPAVAVANAFFFIGLDLVARDRLHELWAGRGLWPRMLALIVAGGALSLLLGGSGRVALASCAAFVGAGAADALAFHGLRGRPWLARANGSNVAGAAVDSLLFPALAFGLPLLWPVVAGQLVAKLAGGLVWSLALARRRSDAPDGTRVAPGA